MSSLPTMLHHSNNGKAHELGTYYVQLHRNNAKNIFMTFKRLLRNQLWSLASYLSNEISRTCFRSVKQLRHKADDSTAPGDNTQSEGSYNSFPQKFSYELVSIY
jgi:hypothetical protein